MLVQKFMRLLLVPGMAVPLVLVACSSDDSHSLMDTALVVAYSNGEFADKIKFAAKENYNGIERSELNFNGRDFVIEIGQDASNGQAATKRSAMVSMTERKQFDHTLMAGGRKFEGYDITAPLMKGGEESGILHAVVFAYTEPARPNPKNEDGPDIHESHLAFGLWMVEDGDGTFKVGAFGPRGSGRASVDSVYYPTKAAANSQVKTATFSGRSIGVRTDGESSDIFNAVVDLTATFDTGNEKYSLGGKVHEFSGIEMMNEIILKTKSDISGKEIVSGDTHLDDDEDTSKGKGYWQAGFASVDSIVGSYGFGFKDGKTHLIGSFGAYQETD